MSAVTLPFTMGELTAGLRRYLADPGLRVADLEPCHGRQGGVCGLNVTIETSGTLYQLECVVKEPRSHGRAGLAHPGVREAGVYRSLTGQLPMATPALIAAGTGGEWLVLEAVQAEPLLAHWDAAAAVQAVDLLAQLHERFWDLADDLGTYPWLARPLTLDYEIHVIAAAQALGQIVRDERPARLAHSADALAILGQVISQSDQVAQALRSMPFTLLHGDYWPGNLLRDDDGELIVLDWQMAAIGPGVLDLLAMVTTSAWEGAAPIEAADMVAAYRGAIARCLGRLWSDGDWAYLWDHALLWRFMQEMLPWAASAAADVYAEREARFEAVWLEPALAAARRVLQVSGEWSAVGS